MSVSDGSDSTPASKPLETVAEASAWLSRVAGVTTLALDTEGDGMFRYRTQLCTVQLCAGQQIAVIDTLRVPAAPLLSSLLGSGGPEKIIHDASFDARILFAHGVVLGNVFDTAVAARFLGFPSTGLSSLLLKLFGLHLPKHQQQADWGLRPIDAEAMRYLENDVRYLPDLFASLLEAVRERDIEPEVREECAYLLGEAQRPEVVEAAWMRIKGSALCPAPQRARLYELAQVRESFARERDLPPARLLASELLLRIARDEDTDRATLERLLGSKADLADAFEQALARARGVRDAPRDQVERLLPEGPSAAELSRRKRRKAWLSEFRAKEAKVRAVDLQVVLPGHCLSDLVDLPVFTADSLRSVRGFGACRFERYGAQLLQLPSVLGE